MPATQGRHGPPFAVFSPLYPALHKQVVLPAAELELPGQLKQVVLSAAMAVAEYWPTRQLMQTPTAVAPCVPEYFPAPQFVQGTLPVTDFQVPATQGRHGPPFAPLYPTLHKQLLLAVLPAAELELPGQLKQVVLSTAMTVAEYWPTRQLMQVLATVAPCVPKYLPAPQAVQAALPVTAL